MHASTRLPPGARASVLAALCALAGLVGCADDGDPSPSEDADAGPAPDARPAGTPDARPLCYPGGGELSPEVEVELGTGESSFEPVAAEAPLVLVMGPQGGFHFVLNARVRGLDPGDPAAPNEANPNAHFRVFSEDGTDLSAQPCSFPQALVAAGDDYTLPYGRVVVVQTDGGLYGQRVRITVDVIDAAGRYAHDERWVTAAVDADGADAGPSVRAPMDAGVQAW